MLRSWVAIVCRALSSKFCRPLVDSVSQPESTHDVRSGGSSSPDLPGCESTGVALRR